MKAHHLLATLLLALPLSVHAQAGRLNLPAFTGLAEKAKESVDISLDGDMLKSASSFMGGSGGKMSPEVADALSGVQGIYIRVFEFDRPGVYAQHDLDGVRRQLDAPGWKKLMSVRSGQENVDMFMRETGPNPADGGIAIVVSEPSEFVIVNIVGHVDLEKLRALQGKFGMPGMPGLLGAPPAPAAAPALPAAAR
jgi:hypothetical protein